MKLARFWTRGQAEVTDPTGERIQVVARGWSDDSMEEARVRAHSRALRRAQNIAADRGTRREYDYDDAPVPEPVVQDFRTTGIPAVVTRNSYGALVLNADELLFADIDQDEIAEPPVDTGGLESLISGIFSLFGSKPEPSPQVSAGPSKQRTTVLETVERVAKQHGFAGRIYKTAAGYRVVVTDRRMRGGSDEAEAILREFGSDPMYMRLCRLQQSFRARLTPKPWRCGFVKPPVKFPLETTAAQTAARRWEEDYNRRCAGYATCQLVSSFGGERVAPELRELLDYHDRETKSRSGLPLA